MSKPNVKTKVIRNSLTRNQTEALLQNMNSTSRRHLQLASGLNH